jgi:hypothetical protein
MTLLGILILYFVVYLSLWLLANMMPILGTIIKGLLVLGSFVFFFFWILAVFFAMVG